MIFRTAVIKLMRYWICLFSTQNISFKRSLALSLAAFLGVLLVHTIFLQSGLNPRVAGDAAIFLAAMFTLFAAAPWKLVVCTEPTQAGRSRLWLLMPATASIMAVDLLGGLTLALTSN